jgi:glutaminyl-peptide cyclotransferase
MAMGLGGYVFGAYHHTHNDNMSIIDKNTLTAVGQTVLQVIYNQE